MKIVCMSRYTGCSGPRIHACCVSSIDASSDSM